MWKKVEDMIDSLFW